MQAQGICAEVVNPVTSCRNTLTFKLVSCCKMGNKLTATHSHRTCSVPVETQVFCKSSVISVPEKRVRKHVYLMLTSLPRQLALLILLAILHNDQPSATSGTAVETTTSVRRCRFKRSAWAGFQQATQRYKSLSHTPAHPCNHQQKKSHGRRPTFPFHLI